MDKLARLKIKLCLWSILFMCCIGYIVVDVVYIVVKLCQFTPEQRHQVLVILGIA